MKILLLKYNKPINEAWDNFAVQCLSNHEISIDTVDMAMFGNRIDQLSFLEVSNVLDRYKDFDCIFIGDIFWPTGQNICRWGRENKVKTLFLQHGQWIYTVNKKNPEYTPDFTCVFGEDIFRECQKWPLSQTSKIVLTGSPRYDFCTQSTRENFDYFAPPVMHEYVPGKEDRYNPIATALIEKLAGLDNHCNLFIHPHYREKDTLTLKKLFPKAVMIDQRDNALNWINRCRWVVTHRNSSSVIDAIACRKLVCLINFDGFSSAYQKGYFGDFAKEFDDFTGLSHWMGSKSRKSTSELKSKKYLRTDNATQKILNIFNSDECADICAATAGGPGAG